MRVQLDYYLHADCLAEAESVTRYLEENGFEVFLPHRDMRLADRYSFEALRQIAEDQDIVLIIWDAESERASRDNPNYATDAVRRLRDVGIHKIAVLNTTATRLPDLLHGLREHRGLQGLAGFIRSIRSERRTTGSLQRSKFFLSYSSADYSCAEQIYRVARNSGSVWFSPKTIIGDLNFMEEIFEAIEATRTFLFLITANSIQSGYCLREVAVAVEKNRRIVPLSELPLSAMPKAVRFAIAGRHVHSVSCQDLNQTRLKEILAA